MPGAEPAMHHCLASFSIGFLTHTIFIEIIACTLKLTSPGTDKKATVG